MWGSDRLKKRQVPLQINAEVWKHNGEENVAQKNS